MLKTTTVKDILSEKGRDVWSTSPNTTVFDALRTMSEKTVGALVVLDDLEVVGVFSERDYARKVILEGKSSKDLPLSEIMTRRVIFVNPENTTEDCMGLMTRKHIRHLPVVEGKELIGIISIGDVVKAIISDQELVIEQLENYITGAYLPVSSEPLESRS
ncbi:MAG: CBS domain-containing protein [Chloroflexi bacterium]|nr:MAG: CBS domain-containing protein [Chloroflexota bacterium]MBL1195717.1 CBS domain-containing protein [Chloroflexota bacterium]NOH13005.1 CBS domain-containing protein [Chloroflexota bacterium]